MTYKVLILAIIFSLSVAQHHHFNIEDLVGHWIVNIEAEKGHRGEGYIAPPEFKCQNYSFPWLHDDSHTGRINHTYFTENHTYNIPHQIVFREETPQEWYIPDRNETAYVVYTDNFEKEQAAVIHFKHLDSTHETVRLLTREKHPSDLAFEDFAHVLEFLNFTGAELSYVNSDCRGSIPPKFDVSVLDGVWHLAFEAFENYTHRLPHDVDACEVFVFPQMLDQDELAEFQEVIFAPNRTDPHLFHFGWKARWHKESPEAWEIDPFRAGEDISMATWFDDAHAESQKSLIFYHFNPENHERSIRLMTREEKVSEAALDHFFILLAESNFHGQIVEFREECRRPHPNNKIIFE